VTVKGFFWGDEKVLKFESGDGCTTCELCIELYALNGYIYDI
jgi:hypothetical protein